MDKSGKLKYRIYRAPIDDNKDPAAEAPFVFGEDDQEITAKGAGIAEQAPTTEEIAVIACALFNLLPKPDECLSVWTIQARLGALRE